MSKKLLTPEEAASLLRLKPNTLAKWRCNGTQLELTFFKIGGRVFYTEEGISQFISTRRRGI